MWPAMLAVLACDGPVPELAIDGPKVVVVAALGPVDDLPVVRLPDGSIPAELRWSAQPVEVAVVRAGALVAVGPGDAEVTASWRDQRVAFTLRVRPEVTLDLHTAPHEIAIGERVQLAVRASRGGQPAAVDGVQFRSSHPDVLEVDDAGWLHAHRAGTAWITAEGHGGAAMAEISVRP